MQKRAKRSGKQNAYQQYQDQDVVDFGSYKTRNNVEILPKNVRQEDYLLLLSDKNKNIVLATGPAGTGKTWMAVLAAIKALKAKECRKIVITRPAVSVDEEHGFLPGGLVEKLAPWTRPIFDVFEEYYSPVEIQNMIEMGIIEVAPLAFMRGRSFKDSYIIADETQNTTREQMKMLLTRIGSGSKIVVTGDLAQHDRGYGENGLDHFISLFKESHDSDSRIGMVEFDRKHVERHPVVSVVLGLYGEK